jgi:hypothetical protein
MKNSHSSENKVDSTSGLGRERLFRIGVIVAIIVAFVVLISIGIYAGLNVLRSPTPTASTFDIDDDYSRIRATATAACVSFMEKFPGTPCPPSEDPDLSAMATQACFSFLEEFPGTPCPP